MGLHTSGPAPEDLERHAHPEGREYGWSRQTIREGGISNGEPIAVRAARKPVSPCEARGSLEMKRASPAARAEARPEMSPAATLDA